jgi:hypothetical protein
MPLAVISSFPEENEMTKQEIIAVLEASDVWTKDRFGHFKLTFGASMEWLQSI